MKSNLMVINEYEFFYHVFRTESGSDYSQHNKTRLWMRIDKEGKVYTHLLLFGSYNPIVSQNKNELADQIESGYFPTFEPRFVKLYRPIGLLDATYGEVKEIGERKIVLVRKRPLPGLLFVGNVISNLYIDVEMAYEKPNPMVRSISNLTENIRSIFLEKIRGPLDKNKMNKKMLDAQKSLRDQLK